MFQKAEVLRELDMYMNPPHGPPPLDIASVQQTLKYLHACNMLFEKGFLSHRKIQPDNLEVLDSWYDALEVHDFQQVSTLERRFLAWQTWDLLRICIYGFREFCYDFFRRHPNYYIVPLKFNGSAVETLFAQIKQAAGGKLDSTNFATAREACLVKRDTHGHRAAKAAHGYRDVPLYVREGCLVRK